MADRYGARLLHPKKGRNNWRQPPEEQNPARGQLQGNDRHAITSISDTEDGNHLDLNTGLRV
jgi:hypothetical protein